VGSIWDVVEYVLIPYVGTMLVAGVFIYPVLLLLMEWLTCV
jgi:hypothetical protein